MVKVLVEDKGLKKIPLITILSGKQLNQLEDGVVIKLGVVLLLKQIKKFVQWMEHNYAILDNFNKTMWTRTESHFDHWMENKYSKEQSD